jgi:hypothetical protein
MGVIKKLTIRKFTKVRNDEYYTLFENISVEYNISKEHLKGNKIKKIIENKIQSNEYIN